MLSHPCRMLLGVSLAVCVGAAAAQQAPDSSSRMPAEKGTATTMPAQPSAHPTDKMSGDSNAGLQGAPASQEPAQSAPMHHARKSANRQHEAVAPEEKTYRDALRQCAKERDESQRDTCLDAAIGQHEPNG